MKATDLEPADAEALGRVRRGRGDPTRDAAVLRLARAAGIPIPPAGRSPTFASYRRALASVARRVLDLLE